MVKLLEGCTRQVTRMPLRTGLQDRRRSMSCCARLAFGCFVEPACVRRHMWSAARPRPGLQLFRAFRSSQSTET